jgi:hypothetical protein
MGVRVVHHKNIHKLQIQPFEHLLKCRIGLEDMNVDIDGMNRSERAKRHFVIGRFCGPGRGRWRFSRGTKCNPENQSELSDSSGQSRHQQLLPSR